MPEEKDQQGQEITTEQGNTQETPQEPTQPQDSGKETPSTSTQTAQTAQTATGQQSSIDTESLKKEISESVSGQVSDQVSKSVLQKIADSLGLSKKEEENLPTDASELQKIVDAKVQEKFEQMQTAQTEEQERTQQEYNQKIDTIIKGWHSQYNEQARLGNVPKIKDASDKNDPGMVARRKLLLGIDKMIKQAREQDPDYDYVPTISDVMLASPNILNAPPGADLPISGNTQGMEDASFSNQEIRNKSFGELAKG